MKEKCINCGEVATYSACHLEQGFTVVCMDCAKAHLPELRGLMELPTHDPRTVRHAMNPAFPEANSKERARP